MKALPDMHTPSDQWLTFAEWETHQSHYARFDRDDTEVDSMIVVPYTYCPNVATILDESNHQALIALLDEAGADDYVVRRHGHWATPYDMILVTLGSAAFNAASEAIAAMADYPVLDESDYSDREHEATLDNIVTELRCTTVVASDGVTDIDPESIASDLFSWFWENDQSAVESRDDQGGWPSAEQIAEALEGLGYVCDEEGGPWITPK